MISPQLEAEILRLYHAEKWRIGTIVSQLGLHHSVVERVLAQDGAGGRKRSRPARLDPYIPLIIATWKQYPKLPASRLYEMCRERGYQDSPHHFRHMVAPYRPRPTAEAYLRIKTLPGEQAQVDWGHFGKLTRPTGGAPDPTYRQADSNDSRGRAAERGAPPVGLCTTWARRRAPESQSIALNSY